MRCAGNALRSGWMSLCVLIEQALNLVVLLAGEVNAVEQPRPAPVDFRRRLRSGGRLLADSGCGRLLGAGGHRKCEGGCEGREGKEFHWPHSTWAAFAAAEPAIRVAFGRGSGYGRPPGHQLELGSLRILKEDGRIGVEVFTAFDLERPHWL
jgi:hypothetical protein